VLKESGIIRHKLIVAIGNRRTAAKAAAMTIRSGLRRLLPAGIELLCLIRPMNFVGGFRTDYDELSLFGGWMEIDRDDRPTT